MRLKALIGAAISTALIASPLAAAGSASALSVSQNARTGASLSNASALQDDEGAGSAWLIGGVVAVAVAVGLYFIIDDDDDEEEASR